MRTSSSRQCPRKPRRTPLLLIVLSLLAGTLAPFAPQATAAGPAPVDLHLQLLTDALTDPLFVTHAGDGSGRLFIVERTGAIWIMRDDALDQRAPFLDLRDVVNTTDTHQGLLGLAFDPDYASTGVLYVAFVAHDGANTIMRFHVSVNPDRVDATSGEVVLSLADRRPDHNLGMLAFGPDGYLYVATGDEGGPSDPFGNAQDLGSLYGKLLRLDVRGEDTYAIPPDNPFVARADARPEIWALGLRSPWRFSFDRATGDLWLGDVGELGYEEINVQPGDSAGGENYGWSVLEGRHCFPEGVICDPTPYVAPADEYDHALGCSVTGGYVYRGDRSPALEGSYLFGDFCDGRIWMLRPSSTEPDGWQRTELWHKRLYASSFGEDEAGELYVTDFVGGKLYRISATAEYPEPVVTGIDPAFVAPGASSFTLNVYGEGFREQSLISWGDAALDTEYVDSTHLRATVAAALVVNAHERPIYVVNPTPGGGASNQHIFRVSPGNVHADAMARTWARPDEPVAAGVVNRTWIWGPQPFTPLFQEEYVESPGGMRAVRYYDKSRMEVSGSGIDPSSTWYVTNGLLAKELMTGAVQLGDDTFEQREPADINVAGDPDDPDGPTYATLGTLLSEPGWALGAPIVRRVDRDGPAGEGAPAGVEVTAAYYVNETGHTVASVFWDFMNAEGVVADNGALVTAPLFENPFYATGFPLTEAYWTTVRVAGEPRDVLVQCFQRRCLTYTPGNPAGWQVEAGNVGRHYYQWRYAANPDMAGQLTQEPVASGLMQPAAMAFAPDGRIFVAEQGGAVRVISDGVLLDEPFVTVTTDGTGEQGLLGLTLDPAFTTNGYVYLSYTVPSPIHHNRVSRFTANGDVAAPESEMVLLELDELNASLIHNGGGLGFGPDGRLYIGTGENGYAPYSPDLDSLLGKILRINPDGTVPSDNPFVASAAGNRTLIWAYGLRNPYSFAFQPETGRMFINDVGSNLWEEINAGVAGANYGWPAAEGVSDEAGLVDPLFVYGNGDESPLGCALTGGTFYNPPKQIFPTAFVNDYFFIDFCRGFVRVYDPLTGRDTDFFDGLDFPTAITTGADGALYVLNRGAGEADGTLVRITLGSTSP